MVTVICIPAYNEERTIAKVVVNAQKYCDTVIVCDDGSVDLTAEIAERLGAQVVRHPRNMGKGEALRSLFLAARKANADVMVTIDGDGQHDPSDTPKLLGPIESNAADIVIGSRFLTSNSVPTHRRLGNQLLNAATMNEVSDTQSGFRAYGRKAIESILPGEMGMGVDSEILLEARSKGLRFAEVSVGVSYGIGKTSTHNPIFHTLDVIFTLLKLTSIRHPLITYGIPAVALILTGFYFSVKTQQDFMSYGITNVTLAVGFVAAILLLFGALVLFTGIILFTIVTVVRKDA